MSYTPTNATVWAEIPVTDLEAGHLFYAQVTGVTLTRQEMGPNPTYVFDYAKDGVGGHIYEGVPAPDGVGPTVHLSAAGKLEDVVTRVWDAGGEVLGEPIALPVGRFVYCKDPDGNSIGLFERV